MRRSRRPFALLGTAASAAALALATTTGAGAGAAPAPAARGAAAAGWRLVFTRHYGAATNASGYLTGVAAGKNHAWAFGGTDLPGRPGATPRAERWNGTSWRGSTLPKGLTSVIDAASATSAGNVWALTQSGGDILHWNRTGWKIAKHVAGGGLFSGVTAISGKDVWVFGAPAGPTGGLGTWHFNGTTWTHETGRANGIEAASAVSAAGIWGIGSASALDDSLVHYDGTTWRWLKATALAGLMFQGILAQSPGSVWATADLASNIFAPRLLHHTSNGWTRISLPWPLVLGEPVPDGRGGLWMTGYGKDGGNWIIHRSVSGTWRRTQVPAGAAATMVTPVLIPGTTSLWAFGWVRGTKGSSAAIWGHGRYAP